MWSENLFHLLYPVRTYFQLSPYLHKLYVTEVQLRSRLVRKGAPADPGLQWWGMTPWRENYVDWGWDGTCNTWNLVVKNYGFCPSLQYCSSFYLFWISGRTVYGSIILFCLSFFSFRWKASRMPVYNKHAAKSRTNVEKLIPSLA